MDHVLVADFKAHATLCKVAWSPKAGDWCYRKRPRCTSQIKGFARFRSFLQGLLVVPQPEKLFQVAQV